MSIYKRFNPTGGGVFVAGKRAGGWNSPPPYLYFTASYSRSTKMHIYDLQDISNHLAKSPWSYL